MQRTTARPTSSRQNLPLWAWNLIGLAVFLALWYLLADVLRLYPPYQMPPLTGKNGVLEELNLNTTLLPAVLESLRRILLGFFIGVGIGFVVGLVLALNYALRTIVGGWLTALQSVPSVAFVPLAIILFGLNERAVFFVVILEAFLPVALAVSGGIANVSPNLRVAGRTLGAQGLALYLKVLLPASLPEVTTALRTAWSFSWRALITAELLTPNLGLGQLLEIGRNTANTALVVLTIFIVAVLGIIMDSVMRAWETRIRRNYGLEVSA